MPTIQKILLDLANRNSLDWLSLTKILDITFVPNKNAKKPNIDDYREQILKPFESLDPLAFLLLLGKGKVDVEEINELNPPIEQFRIDVYDKEALLNLKMEMQGLKLNELYINTIRGEEVLCLKNVYIHFSNGKIEWGPRPVWASEDWNENDLKMFSDVIKESSGKIDESQVHRIAGVFDQFKVLKTNEKGILILENSKFKIVYSSKDNKLDLSFFKGPIAQLMVDAFGLKNPEIFTDYSNGNSLQLVKMEDQPFKIGKSRLNITLERIRESGELSEPNQYDPVLENDFYQLVITKMSIC